MLLENALQAEAFFVTGDFAGDTVVIDRRHVDAVAAGEGDVAGDAGALLGDGLFGDLDQDFLAGLEQVGDRRERGTFGTVAVAEGGTGATVTTAISAAITTTVATISAVSATFTAFATIPVTIPIAFRTGFDGAFFHRGDVRDSFGLQGRRCAGSCGSHGGTVPGASVFPVIATATAATATAATLEAGATIAFAESSRQAMRLAGGFGAAIGRLFAFHHFAVFLFVTFFGIGGGQGLATLGGHKFFGGALGGVGFVFVLVDFGEELFAGFVDSVDVFQFRGVDVVSQFGERIINVLGDGLFGDDRGRLGHRRRLGGGGLGDFRLSDFRLSGDHDSGNGFGRDNRLRFRFGLRFDGGDNFRLGLRLRFRGGRRRRGRRRGRRHGNGRTAVLGERFTGEQEDRLGRFGAQEFSHTGGDERSIGLRGRGGEFRGVGTLDNGRRIAGGVGRSILRVRQTGTTTTAATISTASTIPVSPATIPATAAVTAPVAVTIPEGAHFAIGGSGGGAIGGDYGRISGFDCFASFQCFHRLGRDDGGGSAVGGVFPFAGVAGSHGDGFFVAHFVEIIGVIVGKVGHI
jgi:hypothetical protein